MNHNNKPEIRVRIISTIATVAALLGIALSQTSFAADNTTYTSPAAILRNADDPQAEAALISSDLILYAAAIAERKAIGRTARASIEKTQDALISEFMKALEERLFAWRNSDELLNAALGDLISEFAVMHRFYAPQDEYKLFYEKSVHIRMNTFENQRQNARLERSKFLRDLLPGENGSPGEKARLYANENPLLLEEENDRISVLFILHLLQTTPRLNKLWQTYTRQAELLFGDDFGLWNKVQEAGRLLPLGRDSDLCDENNRTAFRDNLRRSVGDFSKLQSSVKHIPLSLLAMRSAKIRQNVSADEPAEKQILKQQLNMTPTATGAANSDMSLFCVKHGKAKKLKSASIAAITNAYVESTPEKYVRAATNLKATAQKVAETGAEFRGAAAELSALAADIEYIGRLPLVYGDGAVQIAQAPVSLLNSAWLKAALSGGTEFRCIYDIAADGDKLSIKSGSALWQEQNIEYLLPLEEAPELEGNAMLEEAPALVIPDSRCLIRLIAPRIVYRRQIEKFAPGAQDAEDVWSEFPFGRPEVIIPQPN